MRKITILEVLDPQKNEFIPLKQAIIQGLFNTRTYLFYNPVEGKHYSITEAAKRGLFKSAIDLRPESLVIERLRVAQTVSLVSARDPLNNDRVINIVDAIKARIVDTNLRIYRNPHTNEAVDLNEAIDKDLVQVKVVREITEKRKETLIGQKPKRSIDSGASADKPNDDIGLTLIRKIESTSSKTNINTALSRRYESATSSAASSMNNLNVSQGEEISSEPSNEVKEIDGLYVLDRTKSLSVSKRVKKHDDSFAAAFITDSNSKKIFERKQYQSIIQSDYNSLSPIINLDEAIRRNIVILPDSLCLTQNVQFVLDLNSNTRLTFDEACDEGIISVKDRNFTDTRSDKKLSLFEALGKNYIIMRDELSNNYGGDGSDDDEYEDSKDVLSRKAPAKLTSNDISTMFDPRTGEQVSVAQAIDSGLYDARRNVYIELNRRNRSISLEEAVEKGMAVLKPERFNRETEAGYQYLHINGVFNPLTGKPMKLSEAINAGFLDYVECEFHDPKSGKVLTLLEAYDKGFLITTTKPGDRHAAVQSILKDKTNTDAAGRAHSKTIDVLPSHGRQSTNEASDVANFKVRKSATTNDDEGRSRPVRAESQMQKQQRQSNDENDESRVTMRRKQYQDSASIASNQTRSTMRDSMISGSQRDQQQQRHTRTKSVDRYSTKSNQSIFVRLKEKWFSRSKSRSSSKNYDRQLSSDSPRANKFSLDPEEDRILRYMFVRDTRQNKNYDLELAVRNDLVRNENSIRDTQENILYNLNQACMQSLVRFLVPARFSEQRVFYNTSSNSIIVDNYLHIIERVYDDAGSKKRKSSKSGERSKSRESRNYYTLKDALDRVIIDKFNGLYFAAKRSYNLDIAFKNGDIIGHSINLSVVKNLLIRYAKNQGKYVEEPFSDAAGAGVQEEFVPVRSRPPAPLPSDEVKHVDRPLSNIELNINTTITSKPKLIAASLNSAPSGEEKRSSPKQQISVTTTVSAPNGIRPNATSSTLNLNGKEEAEEEPEEEEEASGASEPKEPLNDENGYVNNDVLKQANLYFDPAKKYLMASVFDTMSNKFIPWKKAIYLGIIELERQEYVNSKTGASMSIVEALRRSRIKIEPVPERLQRRNQQPRRARAQPQPPSDDIDDLSPIASSTMNPSSTPVPTSRRRLANNNASANDDDSFNFKEIAASVADAASASINEFVNNDSYDENSAGLNSYRSQNLRTSTGRPKSVTRQASSTRDLNSSSLAEPPFNSAGAGAESKSNNLNASINTNFTSAFSTDSRRTSLSTAIAPPVFNNSEKPLDTEYLLRCILYRKVPDLERLQTMEELDQSMRSRDPDRSSVSTGKRARYIRLKKMLHYDLYDLQRGLIRDLKRAKYVSLYDALRSGLVVLNDRNILFDQENIYIVDSVLSSSGRKNVSLDDAINVKKIIDRERCKYKTKTAVYPIKTAMRDGFIQGKMLSHFDMHQLVVDFVNRQKQGEVSRQEELLARETARLEKTRQEVEAARERHQEPRQAANSSMIADADEERVEQPEPRPIATAAAAAAPLSLKTDGKEKEVVRSRLQDFTDYYVFDVKSQTYVSVKEAFESESLLNEPVRIKCPTTGSYILLKDAVIKGLISTSQIKPNPASGGANRFDSANRQANRGHKDRSSFYTHERVSYIIDRIYDPRKKFGFSLQDATKRGLFSNGFYKNMFKNESMRLDQAIASGLVVGRRVDLNELERTFKQWLQPSATVLDEPYVDLSLVGKSWPSTTPPSKPLRGQFSADDDPAPPSREPSRTRSLRKKGVPASKTVDLGQLNSSRTQQLRRQREVDDETRALEGDESEEEEGKPRNPLKKASSSSLNVSSSNHKLARSRAASRATSTASNPQPVSSWAPIVGANNFIKLGQQFTIKSVLDAASRRELTLEEAIEEDIFDINSAMYRDSLSNQVLTMVDAIDQGLIKISDSSFFTSFKIDDDGTERGEGSRGGASSSRRAAKQQQSIRFVVEPNTLEIIPFNEAVNRNVVSLENGTLLVGKENDQKRISLKEAYDRKLAFTLNDLDNPAPHRSNIYKVILVRKSTSGNKEMSLPSALAKSWINSDRRIYIDRQTNREMTFSQAVDLGLLVLEANLENIAKLSAPASAAGYRPIRSMTTNSMYGSRNQSNDYLNTSNHRSRVY